MARIVLITPYLKGGKDKAHLAYRINYFATREGVEILVDEHRNFPATKKQQAYIKRLIRTFPEAAELLEYGDYKDQPTRERANEFIRQARENFVESMDQRENFLDYIAHRPGVQLDGEHGLWDAHGKVHNLTAAVQKVAEHPGNVWTPVVSLPREDAERLGYDNAANWQALINASICDIARAFKIHPDHLRWYAAFHRKEKNVHIHMVVFSSAPREGYLTKQGIRQLKSVFARRVYRQELICVYEEQTMWRDRLGQEAANAMVESIRQMASGTIQNKRLENLTLKLDEQLCHVKGKKVYGYLPPDVKLTVDQIVEELAQDPRVSHAYELWQQLREKVYSVYSKDLPLRIPLSAQKEFKSVRNMVIRETLRMSQELVQSESSEIAGEIEPDVTAADSPSEVQNEGVPPLFSKERRYWTAKKYLRGSDTTPPDYERAYRLLLLEAKDGNAQAMCDLGRIYREGLLSDYGPAPEMARDWYAKALAAFQEKEQAKPNSRTEYRIARLYADGLGVEADDAEAEHWFRLAAEKENLFAQNALASLLLKQGKPEEAALWLERAAKQGNPAAQYALGRLHLLGTGVPQDRVLAMELLGRSAAQGDGRAAALVKEPDRVSFLPAAMAVTRMLHHMSRIFEHNCKQDQVFQGLQIDRKRWRELQELRIAMGHMPDDHEDEKIRLR